MRVRKNIFVRFEEKFDNSFFIFDLDKGKIFKGTKNAYEFFKLIRKYEKFKDFFNHIKKYYKKDEVQKILKYIKSLNAKGIVILDNEEKREIEKNDYC